MKKLIFPVLMLCLLFTACNSDKEYEVKVPDTEAYTTIAENTEEQIFTSDDGVVIIKPTPQESIIDDDASLGAIHSDTDKSLDNTRQAEKTFTTPEQVKSSFNGSLGHLSIDKIKLSMNVFETDNGMEDMKKGAAHFKDTSVWDGNIGLSAHNGGVKESASFGKLHTLKLGDEIKYKTSLGERIYEVSAVEVISDDDWSYLSRSSDNRVTLITCVSGEPTKRLMVQAIAP